MNHSHLSENMTPLTAHELRLCKSVFFCMWNTLHMTWVNRNGDKPTIRADSFNTIILCHSTLSVSLQMHHTNHILYCSQRVLGASQLLALQHGLRRGAGEQDGVGLQRGENWLDVEPLARQSCVAAARALSLFHGCRDVLMPLCWRRSR